MGQGKEKAMFGRNTKTDKNKRKATVRRATDARKKASKQTKKEGSRIQAARQATVVARNFSGLPLWLWAIVIPIAYRIIKGTWEKEQHDANLRQARRTLREARGFRALPDDLDIKRR